MFLENPPLALCQIKLSIVNNGNFFQVRKWVIVLFRDLFISLLLLTQYPNLYTLQPTSGYTPLLKEMV